MKYSIFDKKRGEVTITCKYKKDRDIRIGLLQENIIGQIRYSKKDGGILAEDKHKIDQLTSKDEEEINMQSMPKDAKIVKLDDDKEVELIC